MRRRLISIASTLFILLTLGIGIYLVGVKTGFIKKASDIPANLVVDAGTKFNNPANCWMNLAQGGESKGRMLTSVVPDVKKLRPQYIRIDHIYDNYDVVGKDGQGKLTFNWQALDLTVQDILATGATPFFSLSYMPPSISKDGKVESEPTNWADWQLIVQKTVEHYSGIGGMNLSNVYYEVWNEPDLYGEFSIGGNKNYLDLYYYAQLGARSAINVRSFKLGGPGTTGLYKAWVDLLLKMAQDGHIRVDFLSWHNYSKNVDNYDSDIQNAAKWISYYPSFLDIELVISELGINSENDPVYDSNLAAINTLATTSVLQGNISKCFNFEIVDGAGPSKLWGRWGILTNEKYGAPSPKSRYYALQFLNNMAGDRISVKGSGSWVKAFARLDGNKLRILIVNYDPFGNHQEAVPITVNNLPLGDYSIRKINFLGASVNLGNLKNTNTWSATLGFSPNSAAIFEITPQ